MRKAGAEVDPFYVEKLKIYLCTGCFIVGEKPLVSVLLKDDMQILLTKMRELDIWVFAAPVYNEAPGPMVTFMDRTLPLTDGIIKLRNDHCRVTLRYDVKLSKIVLVSNCEFWEMNNFDLLVDPMKHFSRNLDREFAGALLGSHGELLKPMIDEGLPVSDIVEAVREAGR